MTSSDTGAVTSRHDAIPSREATAIGLKDRVLKSQNHLKQSNIDSYALSTEFNVSPSNTGIYQGPQVSQASADLLNELLKQNHLNNHVYFSETGGFHNHSAHHLLAAYALGATPQELQLAHDTMEKMQKPRFSIDKERIDAMHDLHEFKSMLGDERNFHNYLAFFLQKFETDGWKEVLTEYLFSDSDLAKDLFNRLFGGIWHSLILIGYGVEFALPGIVAEGLAGACVHSNLFGPYLDECDKLARESDKKGVPLVELLRQVQDDPALINKDHWKGGHSFKYDDAVSSNAPPGMAQVASQWRVDSPLDLPYRTVEMINVNNFLTGAAQRPNKMVKIDFTFMHHVNASIFFSVFLKQDWMEHAVKTRLLESFGRLNLLFYASSLGPELRGDEIVNYKPLHPDSTWNSIIKRCLVVPDDGHLPKLIRALAHGEKVSQPYERRDEEIGRPSLPVKGEMWLQVANMAIDAAEAEPDIVRRWVRGAGSDEAWAEFPDRT